MPTFSPAATLPAPVLSPRSESPHGNPDIEGDLRMQHIDALLRELQEARPTPLLLHLATGFPSALLCVLALGALVGALAGQQATRPIPKPAAATAHAAAPLGAMPAALSAPQHPPVMPSAQAERAAQSPLLKTAALLPEQTAQMVSTPPDDAREARDDRQALQRTH